MKGLLLKPGMKFEQVELNDETLVQDIQKAVGGIYSSPFLSDVFELMDATTFINDSGKLQDLPPSLALYNDDDDIVDYVAGNLLILGKDFHGEVCTLSQVQSKLLQCGIITSTPVIVKNVEDESKSLKIPSMPTSISEDDLINS